MTPDNKLQPDPANDKPPAIDLKEQFAQVGKVVLVTLITLAVFMVWSLVHSEQVAEIKAPTPPRAVKTRIVASKDLEAYTALTSDHLTVIQGANDPEDPNAKTPFLGRYLLTKVTVGTEIKPDLLVPAEAKGLLENSVAVSIPATATSSLGGQLRMGDMIDVLLIHANQAKPDPFELLVLNLPVQQAPTDKTPAEAGAITLAIAKDKRDLFVAALPGATMVITRKVAVK